MRHALPTALAALVLGGCASHTPDQLNGTWINQGAIDTVVTTDRVVQTLDNAAVALEWKLDTADKTASYSTSFERVSGQLMTDTTPWKARFEGEDQELQLSGKRLLTLDKETGLQRFERSDDPAAASAAWGATFEKALNRAFLGGQWRIVDGPGQGNVVRFTDDGTVSGFPALDRYALCLGGDCADMTEGRDSLWLEHDQRGAPWILKRTGKQIELYEALNRAGPTEKPHLVAGKRRWLLELD
ncbi:hypothetical protein IAE35_13310 [Pseudomonas sp. S75]|uniref:hypothetical protein n=1 Tax=unclassified Pseudomonas TaxID=196821 RepID=UPI001902FA54|nr:MULTISPECIES: hypothetical protein [unclassified Pseudomonas]MBJ9974369.1 hypothetical protein [Pseudomonas sp. S30]MBK0154322.1 hypothetical protein [Pseudomonas sp. S75]